MWGHDLRRHLLAEQSWQMEYATGHWIPLPIGTKELRRTSKSEFKDSRELPYLSDLLDIAISKATNSDSIVFTNADVIFANGLTETLLTVKLNAFASRHEFSRLNRLPTCLEIVCARKHCGCDLLLFKAAWWRLHRKEYPPMLIGVEAFDLVARKMLLSSATELHAALAHEEHASYWLTHRADPSALHNRKLAGAWLAKKGLSWD
jgi:hypothetical protein